MTDYDNQSLQLHKQLRGKWEIHSRVPLKSRDDLSRAYTPGVAAVCEAIAINPAAAYEMTMKGNSVAIVSDGSAVLGLGNIGARAALPVMEGKAILFKAFADIDGVPLVVDTQDSQAIINTVRAIAPTFGGINLEDIAAPACFEIEDALQDLGIPVFHDDQHGTAIVLLAALINASKVTGKPLEEMKVVINGAGAAGTAIAKLLRCVGHDPSVCMPVKDILICDSRGIISPDRDDLTDAKRQLLRFANQQGMTGSLQNALVGADVFIGVSKGNLLTADDIRTMNRDPIILAMANPIPEIMPDLAHEAGAAVVGTGRSDFPNQVNNVLVFPGIFRGALDAAAARISESMKIAAAHALADAVSQPSAEAILPDPLDHSVAYLIAAAVKAAAIAEGIGHEPADS
ncbi:MAG: NADP-dependent malic enzyme [Immundisolibacteraceae bacterium]|nr:NADP-dependent malic enzyme [Immundisolibacteraceae bacterium]